jgi:predicted lipid-binding transport protein (Tim44 family)
LKGVTMPPVDATTIVFAIIAIFVVWKLYSVLGTRTGSEPPPLDPNVRRDAPGPGPFDPRNFSRVIRLPGAAQAPAASPPPVADPQRWNDFVESGANTTQGLDAIAAADPSFAPATFLDGAKAAYEAIVVAFAAGDRNALGGLLATDVLDNFSRAISDRLSRQETMQTNIVSIDSAKIQDARLVGGAAQIAVRFASKLISATRDKSGAVIEGSADAVADHLDLWTFAREVASRNPNWRLIATESGH